MSVRDGGAKLQVSDIVVSEFEQKAWKRHENTYTLARKVTLLLNKPLRLICH